MNRPTSLLNVVLDEILMQHRLPANKDIDYLNRRLEKEGVSFLGITLPTFASAIELGLEQGFITRSMFPSFKGRGKGPLPAFLQGLVMKIFLIDGTLRVDADPDAIFGIRQICYWLKKPKADCGEARNKAALDQFINTEKELASYGEFCSSHNPLLRQISDILWGGTFYDATSENFISRHGPGATAEKLMSNERLNIRTWYTRQEADFPSDLHAIPNFGWYDQLASVTFMDEGAELPVRVVTVPKTMKTPRIIAIEPSHMQFLQQGVMRYLVERLESHDLTKRSVRFTNQKLNQCEAKRGSISRDLATLDLSEASDRVHFELVKNIFRNSPVFRYLDSSRSRSASLNGSEPLVLQKFASMGSATCFPVEAMVFYTLIQYSLHAYHSEVPTTRSIRRFSRLIGVYGDDLTVPTYARSIVQSTLESFGLKVNSKKSFSRGFFRESCGKDYYRGYDVTPVYLRHHLPSASDPADINLLMSWAATSDQLYRVGLWKSSQALRDRVEALARMKIGRSPYQGEGLFFYSCMFLTRCRYSSSVSQYVQKRIVLNPAKVDDPAEDVGKVFKALLSSGETRLDFNQSVKRGVFKTKRRWVGATIGLKAA